MCGIVGRLNFDGKPVKKNDLAVMCGAISHRGPDNQGIWVKSQVGLGNRRLSIIDLSPNGNQPISNEDQTVWMTFNGEIYNFSSLKKGLTKKGHKFKSNSDTEVIIHLWEEYGINCLKFLRGMFALALWDMKKQMLFLARDRMGQKPLKYYLDDKKLIFASELKALLATKEVKKEVDLEAVDHFFSLEAVPAPLTGFRGIEKLPQASYLLVKNGKVSVKKYWQPEFLPKIKLTQSEIEEKVLDKLTKAIKLRMMADVEVGAFLSGGVDSSAVVALMSKLGQKKISTFSVGFSEKEYSELKYARIVSKKFKTNHHELILSPQSFSLVSKLAQVYEEPFGDPSALPTYLLSQMASKKLKVVLNGDGGDDIFAGYQRYQKFGPLNLVSRLMPKQVRVLAKFGLGLPGSLGRKTQTLLDLISQPGFGQYAAAYLGLQAPEKFKQDLYRKEFLDQVDPLSSQKLILDHKKVKLDALENVLLADMNMYLAQVLLPKVDMASMSHSLELRSPFLDHELVELAGKIPTKLKIRNGEGKYILKKSLEGILPKEIIYRKKMGFGFPLGLWLRHQWKKEISEVLLSKNAKIKDYLNQEMVKQMIDNPLKGEHYDRRLWRVLMFELWLDYYFSR
jgi:asparagine synthase (glutamine-hydrolysing)